MEEVRPRMPTPFYGGIPHYVVIGIDFGTTYSGVAWTWSKAERPDQINTVHDWEVGAGNARCKQADKVPSKISYDGRGRIRKWGYMVSPQDEYQAEWFKLLLSTNALSKGGERVEKTARVLKLLKKTAVDVVADYLRCLWEHAVKDVELALSKTTVNNMTFKVVLTVPANWDHSAQSLTMKAAQQAGIEAVRPRGPTTLRMVSEPEAAALAAWKDAGLRWRPDLKVGDSFVVCDAGGGTVDLISYTVDSLEPLRLRMCVEATGGLCGAVYLDDAFDNAMRVEVGSSTYDKLSNEMKAKVFEKEWEWGPKRNYIGSKGLQEFSVDIPGYKPKKPGLFSKRPTSIILRGSRLNTMFQPVVGEIVNLVRTQIEEVREVTNGDAKTVLLVGGFGDNDFVLDQLKVTFSPIDIQRPKDAWGAICRGAVIKGLSTSAETETVTNFISKYSYGVKHSTAFNPSQHSIGERYRCPFRNVDMARDQFTWYLKRGQSVSKMEPVKYNWRVLLRNTHDIESICDTIWVSELKKPPSRLDENNGSRKLCQIKCNFQAEIFFDLPPEMSLDGRNQYRQLEYTLNMKVAAGELDWIVYWRDQQRGRAKVNVEYE